MRIQILSEKNMLTQNFQTLQMGIHGEMITVVVVVADTVDGEDGDVFSKSKSNSLVAFSL